MPSKATSGTQFLIPDTLRNWPWPRHLNPHYLECKAESSAWCEAFKAFSPKAQVAFNRCDFNLLACLAYPLHDKAGARIGCDLMNLFFVIDEWSDVADEKGARRQAEIVMDALRRPHEPRPRGEWVGGEVTRQFWLNAMKNATKTAQRRFINTFQLYMDSVVQQAEDRTHNYIRDIRSYIEVRRDTIGAKPSFAILELEMDLPDEVLEHPVITTLTTTCIDMLMIGNDLCSYNVEQARGDDGHNMVTIAMHELKTDLSGALMWMSNFHDSLVDEFLEAFRNLPSWDEPELDAQIAKYVDGLGNWVRANDSWSFESERYFGKVGLEIEKTRAVALLPKQVAVGL